jgi:hypothetical protein
MMIFCPNVKAVVMALKVSAVPTKDGAKLMVTCPCGRVHEK